MKPLTTTTIAFSLFIFSLSAQVIPISNALQTDIAKVISDYPNGFKNIAGGQVMNNPQAIEFECRVSVKDAITCRVIKHSSTTKDIYSWEAEMFKTHDFEVASEKFRTIYISLQNLSTDVNGTTAVFKGDYITPAESLKFTNIVFDRGEKTPELGKLKMALLLESEMLEWVIKILVYEKERDDKDRGRHID